ncbi:transcription/translation regulatory transformer protein RfaH [Candidatus Thioglobus sp.]|nr:transcription/translation regulatory transformer protein RfaH [Candidatus Thioglobus sp.]
MKSWYLLKIKPNQEAIALQNLQNQDYDTYCPNAFINNKKITLFPGYLFINLDNEKQNWLPIRSTKGVLNFVKFGLNFAKVPNNIIQLIKKNEQNSLNKLINLDNFKPGDKVQITEGIFKNCNAIFKSFKSSDRVILLINLLGQEHMLNTEKKSVIGL